MGPRPVWTGAENLALTGIRSPKRPARSKLPYRLRQLGPLHNTVQGPKTNFAFTVAVTKMKKRQLEDVGVYFKKNGKPCITQSSVDTTVCLFRGVKCNLQTHYNWINQLPNTTIWWLDICCLLHRYQLHVSALMAIFRLID